MREMKDSGIEWVGDIPQDWQLSKIGSLYTQRNEKVSDKDYQPLSVTMQGILPQLATAAKTDDGDNRKLVRVGDFAINSRSDRRGSCGISPLDGSVSLINIILTPRTAMHPGYYNWLFHTTLFADEFYKWGHGIVADLWTTRWQEMKSITVPVPEYAEQERIAAFLDAECAEIDAVLEKTRASIEEYKKLKQAVITQAVTKGIRGDRPMKDSGIEWIGAIQKDWGSNTIAQLCSQVKCKNTGLQEKNLLSLSYGKVKRKSISVNPADKVERPKADKFIGSFYDSNEVQALFEAAKGTLIEIPIFLGAFYGLRRSEALGLKWDAIDFQNNTITIRHTVTSCNLDGKHIQIAQDTTKTKSSMRTLPLVPAFKEKLLKLKEQQEEYRRVCGRCYNKKYLEYICVDEMGTLISPHYLTSSFPKLLEKNNLRHIRFHDLRHSCASLLLANGVPMKQIQEWLGHSDFSTTANVYAHLDYNSKLSSADAMVNGLSGALEAIS